MEGYDHWGKVAEKMPGRTAKQCRERWSNYLDPGLLKTPFTQAEDEKLMLLQRMNGNKWALISREMPGRTENSVKLRFNSLKKVYGDSLSSVSMPAPVHIRPHGYMNYDNNYIGKSYSPIIHTLHSLLFSILHMAHFTITHCRQQKKSGVFGLASPEWKQCQKTTKSPSQQCPQYTHASAPCELFLRRP